MKQLRNKRSRSLLQRYGTALVLVAIAVILTSIIQPVIDEFVFALFYVAVIMTAWYSGLGPALVATGVSILASDFLLTAPRFQFSLGVDDLLRLVIEAVVAVVISSLVAQRRGAELQLRESNEALRHQTEQSQLAALRATNLYAAASQLANARTVAEVAEATLQSGRAALDAAGGAVTLVAEEGRAFEVLAAFGSDAEANSSNDRSILQAEALRTREPVFIEVGAYEEANAMRARAEVPLLLRDKAIGLLSFSFDDARTFDSEARTFLLTLAQQCAQALDRTNLYAAERLAHADAEAALRQRDAFLSVAAHELKTPLTSLLGQAQLLRRRMHKTAGGSGVDERQERSVGVVIDQAQRLNTMITALLDISRLEQGRLTLETVLFDICAQVRRIIEELQPTLTNHTIEFQSDVGELLIEGDELRLEQVMQNLIGNAVKYSPNGGLIRVRVSQDDDEATISIQDQGIGIAAADIPRLFEQYYRASNTETQAINGMGIGLFVVREIVALHSGTITVDSQEGFGSTFTVHLPRADRNSILGPKLHLATNLEP